MKVSVALMIIFIHFPPQFCALLVYVFYNTTAYSTLAVSPPIVQQRTTGLLGPKYEIITAPSLWQRVRTSHLLYNGRNAF